MSTKRDLVVEELLGKPSAVAPMLFVGLGGAGSRLVVRVVRHVMRRPDYAERYRSLVKVALVDTNINDLEAYREVADETILISDFEKEQYANLALGKLFLEEDPYFTQWVPHDYRFRAGDTAGAGQIRIESRLGSYYQMKHGDLVPRFKKLFEDLKSHEHGHRRLDTSEIKIMICYSVAGGTGSGSHLPLAYLLRDLAMQVGKPSVLGVAVMPSVFERVTGTNKDGTFANGYAALKETEHLMKMGAPDSRFYPEEGLELHYNPSDVSKVRVRSKPFEFLYIIDKPEAFSVPDVIAAAADGLYLQLFSPLFGEQAGDYDNYTQHQRFLVPHDFEAKGIVGFTSFYGSYGAAVLLVPVAGLVSYCAGSAALSLMRRSFLGDIPAESAYQRLHSEPEPFYTARADDRAKAEVHLADFGTQEPAVREMLRDRLFQKRVRLLASCELESEKPGRFLAMFRHGHRLGEIPTPEGGYEARNDRVAADREQLKRKDMAFSIGAMVLDAIGGARPGSTPKLLAEARRVIEEMEEPERVPGNDADTWLSDAKRWVEEMKAEGIRALKQDYTAFGRSFPGLDRLRGLKFMMGKAAAVDMASKRYAVLCILDELNSGKSEPGEEPRPLALAEDAKGDRVLKKPEEIDEIIAHLRPQAIEWAAYEVEKVFYRELVALKEELEAFADLQRSLEIGFEGLARQKARQLEALREYGDESANRYILDGEALQIESGRRMWDFYYYDQVAALPELSMGDERVRELLNDLVVHLSRAGGSTTVTLEKLYEGLEAHARDILGRRIGGDPTAREKEKKDGLTLSDALRWEVEYRALYLSSSDRIAAEGDKAIRQLVAQYRAQPPQERIDLGLPVHQDYLGDKVKRLVQEKSGLLCLYDSSRDQHGGVRPDNVFLAAIDEDFRDGTIADALRRAAVPNLKWVTKGWHNPQEVVFYRAVLNVPLYVFGRLDEMKHHYYGFKGLAKRSKVLHIDKNWEDTLPDLDPDSAQALHRQEMVREHIVNFATLLTLPDNPRIIRREGHYYLRDPEDAEALTELGATLSEAVERLPEVLADQRVKYIPYQQVLGAVRRGLSPVVLNNVVNLPFVWRRNREELRTQYGTSPTPVQLERLKDYAEAYRRLQEALDGLLVRLRDVEAEHHTMNEQLVTDGLGLSDEQARRNLRQSIYLLERFNQGWQALENPERSPNIPDVFRSIFEPMAPDVLDQRLESLRRGRPS